MRLLAPLYVTNNVSRMCILNVHTPVILTKLVEDPAMLKEELRQVVVIAVSGTVRNSEHGVKLLSEVMGDTVIQEISCFK